MPDDETQEGEETPEPAADSLESRLAALEGHSAARHRQDVLSSVIPAEALSSPVGQFFAQNYAGTLSQDDIRSEAQRLGLLPDPAAADQAGTASDAERAAHDQALDLRHGGMPPAGEFGQHPNETAREVAKAARRTGPEAEALGAYIESHAKSILNGDNRSRIDMFAGGGGIHR